MILGKHITSHTPEGISPLGGNHDKWLAGCMAELKQKFPTATRFEQKRLHAHPNARGRIEVEWTAVQD